MQMEKKREKIHQDPIDYIDIPAPQHSEHAYYRVVYGDVDWEKNGVYERAVYVLMGYENGLNYRRVAHILTTPNEENGLTDLEKVLAAIKKLEERNGI